MTKVHTHCDKQTDRETHRRADLLH